MPAECLLQVGTQSCGITAVRRCETCSRPYCHQHAGHIFSDRTLCSECEADYSKRLAEQTRRENEQREAALRRGEEELSAAIRIALSRLAARKPNLVVYRRASAGTKLFSREPRVGWSMARGWALGSMSFIYTKDDGYPGHDAAMPSMHQAEAVLTEDGRVVAVERVRRRWVYVTDCLVSTDTATERVLAL